MEIKYSLGNIQKVLGGSGIPRMEKWEWSYQEGGMLNVKNLTITKND